MSYLIGENNVKLTSWYCDNDHRMYINFHDDDVGLKLFIQNKETDDLKVELNQVESLAVWKHLNKYFGRR